MTDFNKYILGESQEKISIDTLEENRLGAIALAKQARRSLNIFSYDLDPLIYDNSEFVDAVKKLAISHSQSTVQIILQDSRKVIDNGHRLVELARRISSSVVIRKTPPELKNHAQAFLIADQTGLLYRSVGERFDGYVHFNDRFQCKHLLDFFAHTWEHSSPDPELRRLHI
jgi:hypothetical protein